MKSRTERVSVRSLTKALPLRYAISALVLGCLTWGRLALAGYPPSDQEQYMLEIVNRLRLDPDGEVYRLRSYTWGDSGNPQSPDLNEGITSNFLTDETRQPLAFNAAIVQAARDYSVTLLANDAFTHTYGGTTAQTRMVAAGYAFSGSWTWGENLAVNMSTAPLSISATNVDYHHRLLFIDGDVANRGHRKNLLNGSMKEIGIGIANTASASYNYGGGNWYAVLSTQDFAASGGSSGGKAFLTGVAFSDATNDNNFYDAGEGFNGVTVTATPVGGGAASSTTTWASGGYSLPLAAGSYNVVFSGGSLPSPITYANVAIGLTNVKLDAASDLGVWNVDANSDWSTAGNWSGATPNGVGRHAMFARKATFARTISLSSAQTVGGVSFNNASAGYTVAGSSTLTFQLAGDRARAFVYAGTHTIGAPISLASGLDVTVLGASDSLTLSGTISSPTAQSVVKLGKGALRLAGNSLFSGGLTIADGTVYVGHNNGLGTGTLTLGFGSNDGSLLADAAVTISNTIRVALGSGGSRVLGTTLTSATASFSGPVTLDRDLVVTAPNGGNAVFTGVISGSGGLTKAGLGNVSLTHDAAYIGNTIVTAGTLELQGLSNSGSATVSGTLIVDYMRQESLTINAGGRVKIDGGGTSVVNFLNIANASGNFVWGDGGGDIASAGLGDSSARPVPEPATWGLLVMALLTSLVAWQRQYSRRTTN